MSKLIVALGVVAALMFTSFVSAKDKGAAAGLHGKITAVAAETADPKITDITVTAGKKGDTKDTVIKVDEAVKVTKADGTAGTLKVDVVVGAIVNVTQDASGKVTELTLKAPHAKKAK